MNFNIGSELLQRNLRAGRADSPAVWFAGKTFSYSEIAARVDRIGAALLRAGVQPEQRVLLVLQDSPDLACAYLAAMKIGAVAVPCNPLLRAADYDYFLEESRARVLITGRACFDRVEPALAGCATVQRVLVAGETSERSFERWVEETPQQRVET